jgi:hypothetical protein
VQDSRYLIVCSVVVGIVHKHFSSASFLVASCHFSVMNLGKLGDHGQLLYGLHSWDGAILGIIHIMTCLARWRDMGP